MGRKAGRLARDQDANAIFVKEKEGEEGGQRRLGPQCSSKEIQQGGVKSSSHQESSEDPHLPELACLGSLVTPQAATRGKHGLIAAK